MKYLVEAAWTGVVEVVNDSDFSDSEVEEAARHWLADRLDLKDLIRGISIRGDVSSVASDDRVRVIRCDPSAVGYEEVDDDDA